MSMTIKQEMEAINQALEQMRYSILYSPLCSHQKALVCLTLSAYFMNKDFEILHDMLSQIEYMEIPRDKEALQ